MTKRSLCTALLIAALALVNAASAAEWQSDTRDDSRGDPGQPCGVFKWDRGGAHFDACSGHGPGWDERY